MLKPYSLKFQFWFNIQRRLDFDSPFRSPRRRHFSLLPRFKHFELYGSCRRPLVLRTRPWKYNNSHARRLRNSSYLLLERRFCSSTCLCRSVSALQSKHREMFPTSGPRLCHDISTRFGAERIPKPNGSAYPRLCHRELHSRSLDPCPWR